MIDRQKDLPESPPPETHAEKCPVCNGFGTLKYGELLCHACKGRGFVVIPNKMQAVEEGKL